MVEKAIKCKARRESQEKDAERKQMEHTFQWEALFASQSSVNQILNKFFLSVYTLVEYVTCSEAGKAGIIRHEGTKNRFLP